MATLAASDANALDLFHPLVAEWFRRELGQPTEVQALAWPEIAAGGHVLVTAPTGSGKTLTAFLWALDRLLTGQWQGGRVRVLYVSPLKALNNDIRRNLLAPLSGLRELFEARGEHAAPVRVRTRSGDTPGGERQRMIRHPPEILITTPESLNILLTSKSGRRLLASLACVLLDEIHAVAGGKRGTHLITAIDRLVPLAGEFQRVALSATIQPLKRIAAFVGGFEMRRTGGEMAYSARRVRVVRSPATKGYDLRVCVAPAGAADRDGLAPEASIWDALVPAFKRRIRANRSTLLFANSRRVTEKVTRLLNEGEPGELAYSHHGSLSREIRSVVEKRLKDGRLAAIVATNSLELGIDIGALDEVILIRTPPAVASAVQRIGRAGHAVGQVSRGRLFPLFDRDLLDAAVVARAVLRQEIEEVEPPAGALDVLAQVVLSMTAAEAWDVDELFDFLRSSWPYRHLRRRQFDLVLEMLAGRYADSRIRELRPRLSIDRVDNRVTARPGAARLVYLSGGTIPDRGYFHLRHHETMAKIGELDEEFVWERSPGDTFSLGAQAWRIRRITHNDVLAAPARKTAAMPPFWRAEPRSRSFFLSEKIGEFLDQADLLLAGADGPRLLTEILTAEHCLEDDAARQLVDLLERQRAATGTGLPGRRHLVIERVAAGGAEGERRQIVLHTFWGGRVNRPLAIALEAAWKERFGEPLAVECDDDGLLVELPPGGDPYRLLELVRPDNVEALLRRRLEATGFFGARFRESAGRALLLPRKDFRHRVPLWLNRQRAKKLMEAVSGYEDFPILFETWRTCLQDEFELAGLERVLEELAGEEIRVSETTTSSPSPFAAELFWARTGRLMYEDDTPETVGGTRLRGDLLRELVFSPALRPLLPGALLDRFRRKLHRVYPGYAPGTAGELIDWVRERVAIPAGEWRELVTALEAEPFAGGNSAPDHLLTAAGERLVRVRPGGAGEIVVHLETVPRLRRALGLAPEEPEWAPLVAGVEPPPPPAELASGAAEEDEEGTDPLSDLVAEWLRSYGPVPREFPATVFGLTEERWREVLEDLVEGEQVVVDRFREAGGDGDGREICDARNLERLLRLLRAESRPSFEALPIARLPLFLAGHQGLASKGAGLEDLKASLDKLLGYAAPAALWETALLPARLDPYYPSWLDSLLQESELLWTGCGRETLTFLFPGDLPLLREAAAGEGEREDGAGPGAILPAAAGRLGFDELRERTGLDAAELAERLWRAVWKGEASNTSFGAVRKGLLNRFRAPEEASAATARRRPSRARRGARWRSARPYPGDWFRIEPVDGEEPLDAVDLEELNKERVRLLLDRYGLLFRELLAREAGPFAWSRVFRTLRLMELSGEVLSGQFFEGIPGLQFAAPAAYRRLRQGLDEDVVYWMNALDPASPCGLGLEDLKGELPPRLASNHLVFHGSRLVVLSRRKGGELEVRVGPDHPHLTDYFGFLKVLLGRQVQPLKRIDVRSINGVPAAESPYAPVLAEGLAATRDLRSLKLRRRY